MEATMTHADETPPTPAGLPHVIELRRVSFAYSHGPKVLDGVDFSVADGEFLGLIGPNGGGKTTLLKLVLGLLTPLPPLPAM
jgi:ABC-type Mn2+/Zn2+ transport system ATPase subunit